MVSRLVGEKCIVIWLHSAAIYTIAYSCVKRYILVNKGSAVKREEH